MKTILIPTDFSDNAWRAASYAANLYRGISCRFVIVHGYHAPGVMVEADISEYISSMTKTISEQMVKFEQEFNEFDLHPDSKIEIVARYGVPSSVILNQAKNHFADVIIMGTTGISNNRNIILGSTAIAIMEEVSCPVIYIPEKTEISTPDHIMFATDYNNVTNLSELLLVKEIAEQHNSKISIVNVKKDKRVPVPAEDGMEGLVLHNFFGNIEHDYFDHEEDDVETGILNFARQKQVDLIVTLKRDRSFWKNIFHRSVTKGLSLHSDIPLLLLKD